MVDSFCFRFKFPDTEVSATPGLLKLWLATPLGVAKCNFGFAEQIGLTNSDTKVSVNFTRKLKVGQQ